MDAWRITWFTVATAVLATALMLPPGLALAWLLARGRFRGRVLLETLVSLPLVMPPVATGLVLLGLFAPLGPIGRVLGRMGVEVVFTWKAVVLAMVVMGLPLLVRTAGAASSRSIGGSRRRPRRSGRARCACFSPSRSRSRVLPSSPVRCWDLPGRSGNSGPPS